MAKVNWRISEPPAHVAYAVESLARREGRPLANLLLKLINEALEQRRQAQIESAEHRQFVALLTTPADADAH